MPRTPRTRAGAIRCHITPSHEEALKNTRIAAGLLMILVREVGDFMSPQRGTALGKKVRAKSHWSEMDPTTGLVDRPFEQPLAPAGRSRYGIASAIPKLVRPINASLLSPTHRAPP
jgi:hypothetical protein